MEINQYSYILFLVCEGFIEFITASYKRGQIKWTSEVVGGLNNTLVLVM